MDAEVDDSSASSAESAVRKGLGASHSSPLYEDHPLSRFTNDTRLWRFARSTVDGKINLELGSPKSNEAIVTAWYSKTYISLSYVWGDTAHTKTVAVNGHDLEVTGSLHDFLKTLMNSTYEGEWLWADQISINQRDVEERNRQVRMMAEIFSGVKCVLAFLGNAPSAPIDLQMLGDPARLDIDMNLWPPRDFKRTVQQSIYTRFWFLDDPKTFDTFVGFLDLTRPYWSRLWVVQEVLLAREVMFFCGNGISMGLFELRHADAALMASLVGRDLGSNFSHAALPLVRGHHAKAYINRCFDGHRDSGLKSSTLLIDRSQKGGGLQWTVHRHVQRLCSDPRDKVYGVQSLVRGMERIPVDYNLSQREVVLEMLRKIMVSAPENEIDLRVWLDIIPDARVHPKIAVQAWRLTSKSCEKMVEQLCRLSELIAGPSKQMHGTVRALAWASMISFVGHNITETMIKPSFLASWDELWNRQYSLASTERQKALALDITSAVNEYRSLAESTGERFRAVLNSESPVKEEMEKQKSSVWKFCDDLRKKMRFRVVLDSWPAVEEEMAKPSFAPWRFCDELRKKVQAIITVLAQKHGFALYAGRFLFHPDEWPFPDKPVFSNPVDAWGGFATKDFNGR